jgi:precorrin-2 dehydrogenase/sirohydrochlorin ferrochelatase
MTNTFSTDSDFVKDAVKLSSFYPLAINLQDRKVLVLGGGEQAYREVLRLIDAGAILTILSSQPSEQIRELLVTHASRASILPYSADGYLAAYGKGTAKGASGLEEFTLAFLLSEQEDENAILSRALESCGVPYHFVHQPEKSGFVPASPLKRGHLKIAVATDGLCHPLERAIARRIEEIFVYDFDHYSLFLSALEEKLSAVKIQDHEKWVKLNQRLEGEDFYLALSRKNFEEALRMVDDFIAAIERGGDEAEDEESAEVEINRPRNSGKGVRK